MRVPTALLTNLGLATVLSVRNAGNETAGVSLDDATIRLSDYSNGATGFHRLEAIEVADLGITCLYALRSDVGRLSTECSSSQ